MWAAARPGRRRPSSPAVAGDRRPGRASVRLAASSASLAGRSTSRTWPRRPSRRWPATFSNPARRARSWSPPTSSGGSRSPRRTSSAPMPGGPPILWALTLSRSAPRSRRRRPARARRPARRRRGRAHLGRGTRPRPRRPAAPCRPRGCPTAGGRARCRGGSRPISSAAIDATGASQPTDGHVVAGRRQPDRGVLDGRDDDVVRTARLGGAEHRRARSTRSRRS